MIDLMINQLFVAFVVSFRIAAFMRSMPIFNEIKLTQVTQILLPIALAIIVSGSVSINLDYLHQSQWPELAVILAREIFIGLYMGFSVTVTLTLMTQIGELVGMQAGFSIASMFDPSLGQVSEIGFFLRIITLWAMIVSNFHHVIIGTVIHSFTLLSIQVDQVNYYAMVESIVRLFSSICIMTIRFVLPLMVIILLSHLTMGMISITAPQMNIYFNAAIPMNLALALIIFAYSLPVMFSYTEQVYRKLIEILTFSGGV